MLVKHLWSIPVVDAYQLKEFLTRKEFSGFDSQLVQQFLSRRSDHLGLSRIPP
jgi:hypothetical protein